MYKEKLLEPLGALLEDYVDDKAFMDEEDHEFPTKKGTDKNQECPIRGAKEHILPTVGGVKSSGDGDVEGSSYKPWLTVKKSHRSGDVKLKSSLISHVGNSKGRMWKNGSNFDTLEKDLGILTLVIGKSKGASMKKGWTLSESQDAIYYSAIVDIKNEASKLHYDGEVLTMMRNWKNYHYGKAMEGSLSNVVTGSFMDEEATK
ncbi:hypothetical protein RJT34_05425 [Clitoria ternatea]|uniref:Uncharacterized protein n=1 Tax=Clitoria ternatea TaxID=43366 RepID=A0AAN9PTN2_CLITE